MAQISDENEPRNLFMTILLYVVVPFFAIVGTVVVLAAYSPKFRLAIGSQRPGSWFHALTRAASNGRVRRRANWFQRFREDGNPVINEDPDVAKRQEVSNPFIDASAEDYEK